MGGQLNFLQTEITGHDGRSISDTFIKASFQNPVVTLAEKMTFEPAQMSLEKKVYRNLVKRTLIANS